MTDRPPAVHCFMPHAEAQVAFGSPGHVPARAVRRLALDLELMVAQLGTDNDIVLVRQQVAPLHLQSLRRQGLAAPTCLPAKLDHHVLARSHPLRQLTPVCAQPWAWTPDTCSFFRPLNGVSTPVPRWRPQYGAIWSKSWAARLLHTLVAQGLALDPLDVPQTATSEAQLQDVLATFDDALVSVVVLKAPFSSSGRGALRVRCRDHQWSVSERRWVSRTCQSQGGIVVSPWRQRIADVSVQLDTTAAEPIVGMTGLFCDDLGRYRGNLVHRPLLCSQHEHTLVEVATTVADALLSAGHQGRAGVDAMVYLDQAGEQRLQPLLEVNVRTTMGHIALALRDRLPADAKAALRIYGPRDLAGRTPAQLASDLRHRWPTVATQGHISGCLFLNDPTIAQAHLAVLHVGDEFDARFGEFA